MDVADRSSSNDLSDAPNSDIDGSNTAYNASNTITVSSNLSASNPAGPKGITGGGVAASSADDRQEPILKQRRPRKKKDNDATPVEKKEKGTRRPRGASTAAGSVRKKLKTEPGTSAPPTPLQNVQSVTETAYPRSVQQTAAGRTTQQNSATNEAAKFSQNGFLNNSPAMSVQKPILSPYNPTPPPLPPSQPHVARSMAYDPVRGMTTPRNTEPPSQTNFSHSNLSTPPRTTYNPSTSPAILSIINPPEVNITENKPAPLQYLVQNETKTQAAVSVTPSGEDVTTMDIDPPAAKSEPSKKATPEAAPPKPASKPRAKEQPPPMPAGSGLLSSTLFGGDSGMDIAKNSNDRGTSIVLHVDLKDPNNKIINFARMAEEKYGFAALYPRQAAQKERLAKVAAAGAALERAGSGVKGTPAGESGDEDVSVDIDRDSDNDGDVAMSGMNGTGEAVNSGTDGPVPKRRKRKDEYDADDPFVDDSELLWEAQAAASKDGFFVYCGPLVPEGEKPAVERADGTVKRGRGRGRGGGPGSRGGRGGAAAARDGETGGGRGGGPGSRGGGITRKPRITKAERAQRELEKKQREQMATLAAKPPNYQP